MYYDANGQRVSRARWKQMEEQFAQRRAQKGRSALIALAIVGGVLLLRFLAWLARSGK